MPAPAPAPVRRVPRDAGAGTVAAAAPPAVYLRLCAPCHGAAGKGYVADHAPSLVNPTFLATADREFLRRSIALGRPGTAMAAYGEAAGGPLDDRAIDDIASWLVAQAPPWVKVEARPRGDARRGAPLYAQMCQRCHGDTTTRGEGVHLANPRFLDAASDELLRYAIANGRPGTPMEAFADKLRAEQIDDVIAFVREFADAAAAAPGRLAAPTGKEPIVINPRGKSPRFELRAEPCPKLDHDCKPDARFVPAAQVKAALDDHRKLVIVDARPASEWRTAHVTGAVSIPHHDLARLADIPTDVWVVAYCACPHHLSGIVVDELRKRGHAKAAVLDEGILEWQRRGYPIVAAPGVTAPPRELGPR